MNAQRERPILFNGEMVRAILDGRKTQTRRVVKSQPVPEPARFELFCKPDGLWVPCSTSGKIGIFEPQDFWCPYGTPGDRLWVRETWVAASKWDDTRPRDIPEGEPFCYPASEEQRGISWGKNRPSIFLPRWASRILIEVVSVKVERVQEISEDDAIAEGITEEQAMEWYYDGPHFTGPFIDLWDSINAKRGYDWDANPWVWVVEFKRI